MSEQTLGLALNLPWVEGRGVVGHAPTACLPACTDVWGDAHMALHGKLVM